MQQPRRTTCCGSAASAVLLKGGHLAGDTVHDVLATAGGQRVWESPRIDSRHTHGTGCTLASAIAAGLAQGLAIEAAVERARDYVQRAIASAPGIGGATARSTTPTRCGAEPCASRSIRSTPSSPTGRSPATRPRCARSKPGCPTDVMQAIAAENNLSETAFFVPEGDGYRLRWFTPTVEVDLCGHATLASAFVVFGWLAPGAAASPSRPRKPAR